MMDEPGTVAYVELGFRAELEDEDRLPPFMGATLRGAFGYLLKRTVCQIQHGVCSRCVLQTACPYPALFEGLPPPERTLLANCSRIPQPFVLVVPPPLQEGEARGELTWNIRLFGEACRYWPYVVHIFQLAGQQGIGSGRVKYRLKQITDETEGTTLWSPAYEEWQPPSQGRISANHGLPERCSLRWRFATPLRIAGRINGLNLVLAGRRRFRILKEFYGNGADNPEETPYFEADEFTTRRLSVRPWTLRRYSGRQQQRMHLKGFLGEAVIEGPWGRAGPWLHAAEMIHLGKATSFGFGRVAWEVV